MRTPSSAKRRSLLKLGLIGTALLAAGGFVATRLTDGSPSARLAQAVHLDAGMQSMLARVFEGVLDGMLPTDPAQRQAQLDATLSGLDKAIGNLPLHVQSELKDLLGVLTLAPTRFVLAGRWSGWEAATVKDVQAMLTGLRTSAVELRRLIYVTLRDLAAASYYAMPETWSAIGYRGPLVPGPGEEV